MQIVVFIALKALEIGAIVLVPYWAGRVAQKVIGPKRDPWSWWGRWLSGADALIAELNKEG